MQGSVLGMSKKTRYVLKPLDRAWNTESNQTATKRQSASYHALQLLDNNFFQSDLMIYIDDLYSI